MTSRIWIVIWQIDVETSIWQSNLKSHVNTSNQQTYFETLVGQANLRPQFWKPHQDFNLASQFEILFLYLKSTNLFWHFSFGKQILNFNLGSHF